MKTGLQWFNRKLHKISRRKNLTDKATPLKEGVEACNKTEAEVDTTTEEEEVSEVAVAVATETMTEMKTWVHLL